MSVYSYQQCSRYSVTLKSILFGVRNTVAARDVLFSTLVQSMLPVGNAAGALRQAITPIHRRVSK